MPIQIAESRRVPVPRVAAGADHWALFSYGFRPFFLFGALWAALAVALWIPVYFGVLTLPIAIEPIDWHIHELLYGYLSAVVAGFLLTAIPNWTGRLPLAGRPLMLLVALWAAGRIAMLTSAWSGAQVAAAIDFSFLPIFAMFCVREIVVGKNWRNLRVVVLALVLSAGNAVFHAEIAAYGTSDIGRRLGMAAAIAMIALIGGRVIPSFTRNWLARAPAGTMPAPFSRFDGLSIIAAVVSLGFWVAWPHGWITATLLMTSGVLHAWRLGRWAGYRAARDPLVLVLHGAYAFVPLGFLALAAAIAWPTTVPIGAGVHLWTAGAVAGMTLAVMTRATLGHTGRALVATPATNAIYVLAGIAIASRAAAAIWPTTSLLLVATVAWIGAFGGFVAVYGPMLVQRRKDNA